MTSLTITPNLPDPDGFYEELITLHDGKTKERSDAINAKLVLILANHIGDQDILREAMALAIQEPETAEAE